MQKNRFLEDLRQRKMIVKEELSLRQKRIESIKDTIEKINSQIQVVNEESKKILIGYKEILLLKLKEEITACGMLEDHLNNIEIFISLFFS